MIQSAHRFHGRSSLRFVFQRGQVVRGAFLSLRFVRNTRQQSYRVAVVVSRKVSKSAVVRNRIRRRLYEVIRTHADRIAAPHDLVFSVYSDEIAHLSHAKFTAIILEQLQKAGVFDGPSEAAHDIVRKKETDL
jgi:ribonuclease P protein component